MYSSEKKKKIQRSCQVWRCAIGVEWNEGQSEDFAIDSCVIRLVDLSALRNKTFPRLPVSFTEWVRQSCNAYSRAFPEQIGEIETIRGSEEKGQGRNSVGATICNAHSRAWPEQIGGEIEANLAAKL